MDRAITEPRDLLCAAVPLRDEFENTVAAVLNTCPPDTVFLAAVSGGADSMAMLTSLCSVVNASLISPSLCEDSRVHVLHVEHGLRPAQESRGDAEFVRDFCEKRLINCRIVHIPQGKITSYARRNGVGIEAAARFFRHRALFREARRLDKYTGGNTLILTAHTKDDMLELSLMRILRGAGPAGLASMPVKKGRFLRPLLSMSRADVIAYLKEKNIPWREDSTNKKEDFLRNKVRLRLIPLLNEFFPSWEKGLAGMTETQSHTAAFITSEAAKRILWEESPSVSSSLYTDAYNFFAQPQIVREEALFLGINRIISQTAQNKAQDLSSLYASMLMYPSVKIREKSINRKIIRRFCEGEINTADFTLFRIRQRGGKVALSLRQEEFSECGFSLLIKESGLYNLINKTGISVQEKETESGKNGFWAALPLIIRPAFKDDFLVNKGRKISRQNSVKNAVSAADRFGVAAFLELNGNLFCRDMLPETDGEKLYYIRIL